MDWHGTEEIKELKARVAKLLAALEGTLLVIEAMKQKAPEAMHPGFEKWREKIVEALAKDDQKMTIK